MDGIIGNSTDSEGPTHLQKVLEMCIGIFIGLPENGFSCTILINTGLSSKFPSPTVVVGLVGTLVLDGAENSRIVLSAISADEVMPTGSTVFIS
jgi:hypothetical protein